MSNDYSSEEEIPIQIIGVSPLGAKDLYENDKLSIQLIFDQQVDTRMIASN